MRAPRRVALEVAVVLGAVGTVFLAATLFMTSKPSTVDASKPEDIAKAALECLQRGDIAGLRSYCTPATSERIQDDPKLAASLRHGFSENSLAIKAVKIAGDQATVTILAQFVKGTPEEIDLPLRKGISGWLIEDPSVFAPDDSGATSIELPKSLVWLTKTPEDAFYGDAFAESTQRNWVLFTRCAIHQRPELRGKDYKNFIRGVLTALGYTKTQQMGMKRTRPAPYEARICTIAGLKYTYSEDINPRNDVADFNFTIGIVTNGTTQPMIFRLEGDDLFKVLYDDLGMHLSGAEKPGAETPWGSKGPGRWQKFFRVNSPSGAALYLPQGVTYKVDTDSRDADTGGRNPDRRMNYIYHFQVSQE